MPWRVRQQADADPARRTRSGEDTPSPERLGNAPGSASCRSPCARTGELRFLVSGTIGFTTGACAGATALFAPRRGNDAGPRSRSHSSHNVEVGSEGLDHSHLAFLQVGRSGNTVEGVAMAGDAEIGS